MKKSFKEGEYYAWTSVGSMVRDPSRTIRILPVGVTEEMVKRKRRSDKLENLLGKDED